MDVGVRELKLHLTQYLARVRAGESLTVTTRGKPVARIEPIEKKLEPPASIRHLVDAGTLVYRPPPRGFRSEIHMTPGEKTATDFIVEQRR